MKTEDFEKRVQRQTLRQVPAEWREDILSAARQASSPEHATRNTQHASPWRSVLSTLNAQLSTLLWPRPAAWAGLAAVWVMVLALHLATREGAPRVAKQPLPRSPQVLMVYQEQERLLAELMGPRTTPAVERVKALPPRPRSERGPALSRA